MDGREADMQWMTKEKARREVRSIYFIMGTRGTSEYQGCTMGAGQDTDVRVPGPARVDMMLVLELYIRNIGGVCGARSRRWLLTRLDLPANAGAGISDAD